MTKARTKQILRLLAPLPPPFCTVCDCFSSVRLYTSFKYFISVLFVLFCFFFISVFFILKHWTRFESHVQTDWFASLYIRPFVWQTQLQHNISESFLSSVILFVCFKQMFVFFSFRKLFSRLSPRTHTFSLLFSILVFATSISHIVVQSWSTVVVERQIKRNGRHYQIFGAGTKTREQKKEGRCACPSSTLPFLIRPKAVYWPCLNKEGVRWLI